MRGRSRACRAAARRPRPSTTSWWRRRQPAGRAVRDQGDLPEWQVEPDEEAWTGEPDDGLMVDARRQSDPEDRRARPRRGGDPLPPGRSALPPPKLRRARSSTRNGSIADRASATRRAARRRRRRQPAAPRDAASRRRSGGAPRPRGAATAAPASDRPEQLATRAWNSGPWFMCTRCATSCATVARRTQVGRQDQPPAVADRAGGEQLPQRESGSPTATGSPSRPPWRHIPRVSRPSTSSAWRLSQRSSRASSVSSGPPTTIRPSSTFGRARGRSGLQSIGAGARRAAARRPAIGTVAGTAASAASIQAAAPPPRPAPFAARPARNGQHDPPVRGSTRSRIARAAATASAQRARSRRGSEAQSSRSIRWCSRSPASSSEIVQPRTDCPPRARSPVAADRWCQSGSGLPSARSR
jgi:hypothetical protein